MVPGQSRQGSIMPKITLDAIADLLVQSGSVPAALCPERARLKQYVSARHAVASARAQRVRTGRRANPLLLADAARIRRNLAETSDGRCLATVFVAALRWEARRTAAAFGQEPPQFTYHQAVQAVRAAIRRLAEGVPEAVSMREAA